MSVSHRCTALLAVLLPFASAVLRPAGPVLPTQRTYARTWPARAVALRPAEHSDLRRTRAASVLRMKAESADPDDGGSSAAVSSPRARPSRSANPSFGPIAVGVFTQMLGEGIAISSLPLHMTLLGASPVLAGAATSCFSVAQMFCCPLLVRLSTRLGRTPILRACLAGAAASSLLIGWSGTTTGILIGRCLAGVFAASVPVAQAAVTDVVPANQTALALSRVSAASQLGVVVGPAAAALLHSGYGALGVPPHLQLRAVFLTAAALAVGVLAISPRTDGAQGGAPGREGSNIIPQGAPGQAGSDKIPQGAPGRGSASPVVSGADPPSPWPLTQPCLRLIAGLVGWSLTLCVGTYGLFAPRILGYAQPQLSVTYSVGAAVTVLTQVAFPRIVTRLGEHVAASLGLGVVALGLSGFSLVVSTPAHQALYMLCRVGTGVADTSVATLVAGSSCGAAARSHNLALIASTRAAARIVTPLVSGVLFSRSLAPGALPYLANAALALCLVPLPLLLRHRERESLRAAAAS